MLEIENCYLNALYVSTIKYYHLKLEFLFLSSTGYFSGTPDVLPALTRLVPMPEEAGGVTVEPAGQEGCQGWLFPSSSSSCSCSCSSSMSRGSLYRGLEDLYLGLLEYWPAACWRAAVGRRAGAEDPPDLGWEVRGDAGEGEGAGVLR